MGPLYGKTLGTPNIANIRPSSAFLIWDGPQLQTNFGNGPSGSAYPLDQDLDGNELTFGSGFCLNSPDTSINYNRPVEPGGLAQTQTPASQLAKDQQLYNMDGSGADTALGSDFSFLRFRHQNNTVMNALCVDGHVESRQINRATGGNVMMSDLCIVYHR